MDIVKIDVIEIRDNWTDFGPNCARLHELLESNDSGKCSVCEKALTTATCNINNFQLMETKNANPTVKHTLTR